MNHKHFFLVPKYFLWIHIIDKLRHLTKTFRLVWAYPKILPYSFLQSMIACNCPYNGITITIINSTRQFNIKGDNVDILTLGLFFFSFFFPMITNYLKYVKCKKYCSSYSLVSLVYLRYFIFSSFCIYLLSDF